VTDWALPLADLVSLLRDVPEHVSGVKVANGSFDPESRSDYVSGNVYGPRIARTRPGRRRFPADGALPIVPRLFTLDDAPPLAQLIRDSPTTRIRGATAVSLLRLAHDPTLPDAVTFTLSRPGGRGTAPRRE